MDKVQTLPVADKKLRSKLPEFRGEIQLIIITA